MASDPLELGKWSGGGSREIRYLSMNRRSIFFVLTSIVLTMTALCSASEYAVMRNTAAYPGVKDSFDSTENVEAGTRYLRQLLEQFNYDAVKALAAYNAGPDRVTHYRGVPPYDETRNYVARIVRDYNRKKAADD